MSYPQPLHRRKARGYCYNYIVNITIRENCHRPANATMSLPTLNNPYMRKRTYRGRECFSPSKLTPSILDPAEDDDHKYVPWFSRRARGSTWVHPPISSDKLSAKPRRSAALSKCDWRAFYRYRYRCLLRAFGNNRSRINSIWRVTDLFVGFSLGDNVFFLSPERYGVRYIQLGTWPSASVMMLSQRRI